MKKAIITGYYRNGDDEFDFSMTVEVDEGETLQHIGEVFGTAMRALGRLKYMTVSFEGGQNND